MAGDPLSPVAAGTVSPFVTSERTVNAALERLRAIGAPERAAPVGGAYPVAGARPQVTVFVRNDTGATLSEFSVVKLGEPIISASDAPFAFQSQPIFPATAPSAETDAFAVLQEPLAANGIGRAVVLGVAVCDVTFSSASHGYAKPGASTAALDSAASGPAKIVWSAGTTGTQRAVVILQGDMGGGGGSGDVVGPSSATDNAIARYDTTTGKLIQNSAVTISDAGKIESGSGNSKLELDNTRLFIGQQGSGSQYGYAILSSGKVSDGTLGALVFASFPGGGLDSSATIAHAGDGITCTIGDTARARFKIVSNNASTNDPFFSVDRNGSEFDGVDATLPDGSVVKGGIITTAGSGTFLTTASAAATYLTQANAATTYLTQADAATTYQPLDGDLTAIAALSGTDTIYYRSGASTWSAVTIGSNLAFSGGTLSATASGTVTSVGITAPAAGITVSGSPVTTSGAITLALADDLAALESFSGTGSTGIPVRTGANTWASLTLGSYLAYDSGTLNSNSPTEPGGRLTLSSGVPVTTANSGATVTTIYYTPYLHDSIQLWDGSAWKTITFSEVSNTPSIPAASRPRDVFGYLSGGALAIETTAWTNDTTRTTDVVYTDGRLTKSGDKTRLYLGTVRTKSDGYFMDSETQRFVWNMYNRVPKSLIRQDTTSSWNYTTATWRSTNNSTGNRVEVVAGQAGQSLRLEYIQASVNVTANVQRRNGIGEDSTTTNSAKCGIGLASNTAATSATAILSIMPTVGYHYYQMLEWSLASGTSTWFGLSTDQLCQLSGEWLC